MTGDDKSSWFSVMSMGYQTFYVPDAIVKTIEHPPQKSFFKSSLQLMYRWYGNSLRQNTRALKLGPARMGWYTWYVLLDQRISMWTCLIGPVFVILASIRYSIDVAIAYLLWIGITRLIMMMAVRANGHPVSALFPPLIYYNQVVGSLVKTYVSFRIDKQSWTRQDTKSSRNMNPFRAWFNDFSTNVVYVSSLCTFFAMVMWVV